MADMEKLEDQELDAVSGGVKYTVGPAPIYVFDAPGGNLRHVLYQGDYFVTDGQVYWVGGTGWAHIYLAHGDGYVDSRAL